MPCSNGTCSNRRPITPTPPAPIAPGALPAMPPSQVSGGGGNWFTGYKGQTEHFPLFNTQQIGAQGQALQQALSMLQGGNLPGQFNFAPIAQQARSRFFQETVPTLAERFTAMGGGQRSSAFQGALGRAGSGLEEALASLESKYNLAQQGPQLQLLQMLLGAGLQPQYQSAYSPGQPGFLQAGIPGLLSGVGKYLAGLF